MSIDATKLAYLIRKEFEAWYQLKYSTKLPLYLPSDVKKILVNKFELETGKKYLS
jgi:hypothetical protein